MYNIVLEYKTMNLFPGFASPVYSPPSWPCLPGGSTPGFPVTTRRGSLQLWQFLVTLLDDPANSGAITWTGRGMEFKLIEPEEVRDRQ